MELKPFKDPTAILNRKLNWNWTMEMNVQTDLEDVGSWFDLCAERTVVIRGQGRDLRGFTLGV